MFEKASRVITSESIKRIVDRNANDEIDATNKNEEVKEDNNINIQVPIDIPENLSVPAISSELPKKKKHIESFDGNKFLWLYNQIEEAK
jgi:hypothetical protein